jgi:hypothetical protein
MSCLRVRLIVLDEVRLNLGNVIVSIRQRIVYVRQLQVWILLDDLFHSHAMPIASQDRRDANSRAGNNRLSAATPRISFNVSVV